jgi:hypothetical protein
MSSQPQVPEAEASLHVSNSGSTHDAEAAGASTTWAIRNPHMPVQDARKRARHQLTGAELISRALLRQSNKLASDALQADVHAFSEYRESQILELAEKHHKKAPYIQRLLTSETSFKPTRKVSIQNAIIHHKSMEVNESTYLCGYSLFSLTTVFLGRSLGDRLSLSEVQDLVSKDETLQDMSSERQQELIDQLVEHRKLKTTGARVSNVAAASDIRVTMGHISDEVRHIYIFQ